MTTIYRQLKEQLPIKLLSVDVLFALRLLFDHKDDIVDLDADIDDLHHYPERLFGSYRPEWEVYVTRALATKLQNNQDSSITQFVERVLNDVSQMIEQSARYAKLHPVIVEAKTIQQSANTVVFPTPWRQQITALLLPASTLYKSNR